MKKFLLSFLGAAAFFCSEAQLYLNELYVRPNPNKGNHEYFEVFNAGVTPEAYGTYTLVTYFNDGKDRGLYVVNFPDGVVSARDFIVGSSVTPTFKYQNGTASSDFSWNSGNINRYVYTGGALVLNNAGAPFDNIFFNKKNGIGESELYSAFLFDGNMLVDAFLGHSHSITVPSYITEMGTVIDGAFSYNFSTINSEPDEKFGYV